MSIKGRDFMADDEWGSRLKCGECSETSLHISSVDVSAGETRVRVEPGVVVTGGDPIPEAAEARGSVVVVNTWCELCGDFSGLVVQFHKGAVFLHKAAGRADSRYDLWRD